MSRNKHRRLRDEKSLRRAKSTLPAPNVKSPARSRYHCAVCCQSLHIAGGYAQTGLCGPCATGEAETIEEYGESW